MRRGEKATSTALATDLAYNSYLGGCRITVLHYVQRGKPTTGRAWGEPPYMGECLGPAGRLAWSKVVWLEASVAVRVCPPSPVFLFAALRVALGSLSVTTVPASQDTPSLSDGFESSWGRRSPSGPAPPDQSPGAGWGVVTSVRRGLHSLNSTTAGKNKGACSPRVPAQD